MLFINRFIRFTFFSVILLNLAFSQSNDELFNVQFNDSPLDEVLDQLIQNENLLIVYQDNHVRGKNVTFSCDSCNAEGIIDEILYNTKLAWKKNGEQFIIIKPWINSRGITISGIVYDSQTGEPLPYVNIAVKNTYAGDVTNPDGYFAISGIKSKTVLLQSSYIGYEPQELLVSNFQKSLDPINIKMIPNVLQGKDVNTFGEEFEILHSIESDSRIAFAPRQISALPSLGEVDIMRSLQMYPGISVGRIGTAGLFIRGGTPDQNLITFDGMTLYHIDHFFGFFSAFNPNAVKNVQVYKSVFPVKYGGRISGIVELSGKNGDSNKKHFSLSSGMLSTGMVLELPLWKRGSIFLSARRSHIDYFKTPIYDIISGYITGENYTGVAMDAANLKDSRYLPQPFKPQFYFYDLNGKITLMPSKRDVVSLSVYKGLDYFDQTTDEKSDFQLGGDSYSSYVDLHDRSSWGNFGTSFRWSRHWHPKIFSHLFLANTSYNSETFSKSATDTSFIYTLPIINLNEKNEVKDTSIRLESEWVLSAKHKAELGLGASLFQTEFSTSYAEKLWSVDKGNNVLLSHLYLQDQWTQNNKLQLTTGIRSNYFDKFDKLYYEPRVALRYLIDDDIALKASFGQYYQFINRFINENSLDGANDFWLVVGDSIKPASSKNLILGIHNTNTNYSFGVEAYLKVINNLTEYNRQQTILAEVTGDAIFENVPLFYVGKGYSQGFELSMQKKRGMITGWASYNFGKVEYTFPKLNEGISYLADHDRTHEFKCMGSYSIGTWNFSASWVLSSGRVYTDVDQIEIQNWDEADFGTAEAKDIYYYVLQGKRNQNRLPPLHWLEIAINKKIAIGKISSEINLSIFNVYNQRNISYRRYEYWKSPVTITDVAMIGFTPSLSIKVNF
jgi:hypothetical protein